MDHFNTLRQTLQQTHRAVRAIGRGATPYKPGMHAIRIYSLTDAQAILTIAAELGDALAGQPVYLLSPQDASKLGGLAWFQTVIGMVTAEYPDILIKGVMDCSDRAGDVMAALRAGITKIRYHGDAASFTKLQAMAGQMGAHLYTELAAITDARNAPNPEQLYRAALLASIPPDEDDDDDDDDFTEARA